MVSISTLLIKISIHTLRMEGDYPNFDATRHVVQISIHTLRMEGDGVDKRIGYRTAISIHTLRMEGDRIMPFLTSPLKISIHTLRMEGDWTRCSVSLELLFQSTPSAWRVTAG